MRFKPFLRTGGVEIQKEANVQTGKPQVGEKLRLVYGKEPLDRLQFDNHRLFHNHVNSITTIKFHAFGGDGKIDLLLPRQATHRQLSAQAMPVRRLQQSRSQCFVNLNRPTNDRVCDGIYPRLIHLAPLDGVRLSA